MLGATNSTLLSTPTFSFLSLALLQSESWIKIPVETTLSAKIDVSLFLS
jgi:hypothetical protein